ncbi:hypothetical protein ASE13_09940 [Sphingomonas sp. Root241]|nr:hypothetical protein ASE13_09940 [Sphingomonas sp. Root241]
MAARAQVVAPPSRTTPQSAAPVEPAAPDGIVLPQTRATTAPAGAEKLQLTVGRVRVEGADPAMAIRIAPLAAALEGQRRTVADLYKLAARIEALYAQDGQVLTRAAIPPQTLKDGDDVRIVIVEGFVETIDTSRVPAAVRGAVARRLAGLLGKKGLRIEEIERRVLLASRLPGVTLESTLVPGEQAGGAQLVIEARHRPLSASLSASNPLGEEYGHWSFDLQLAANGVLGAGEQVYAFASTARDFGLFSGHPRRHIAALGGIVPIGADGLSANLEYLRADTDPELPASALAVRGALDHMSLRLHYPLVLTRRETLNLTGSFEILDERQTARRFGVMLSNDKLRFATFGAEWGSAISRALTLGGALQLTQGFDIWGARDGADAMASGVSLSRQGGRPDFTKLDADLSALLRADDAITFALRVRGQISVSGALPASAQFALDAGDALSGFDLGTLNVDSGFTGRIEAQRRVVANPVTVTPYLFVAAGRGALSKPTALEPGTITGWSFGGGLRAAIGGQVSLEAEIARTHAESLIEDETKLVASMAVSF